MKKLLVATACCATLLTGCGPDNLVVWSPDGKQAAVLASDGLRLGDETGRISTPILAHARLYRWLPDAVHGIVISTKETARWSDVRSVLPATERLKIARSAEALWKSNSAFRWKALDSSMVQNVLVYLNYKYGVKPVKAKLNKIFKTKSEVSTCVTISALQKLNCSSKNPSAGAVLWRTTKDIGDVRISPSGTLAAVSVSDGFAYKIIVVPLAGGEPKTVTESLADFPDWSPDGQSLFYISYPPLDPPPASNRLYDSKHPCVATLNRREIADKFGLTLPKFAAVQTLAEVLASDSSRVRCLPDGSVVFNSKQRSFPSIKKAEPSGGLFRLSPDLQSVERIAALTPLPQDELASFEPNQDGTKIVVPGSKGEITVLDVSSGDVKTLEKAGSESLQLAPQWRTKDELCYASRNHARSANGHDVEVVLQSLTDPDRRTIISKDWPATTIEFLKDHDDPAPAGKSRARLHKSLGKGSNCGVKSGRSGKSN